MLRAPLLAAARSKGIRRLVEAVPATRSVVRRFVAGSETADAVRVARERAGGGRRVAHAPLGEGDPGAGAAEAVGATVTLDMEDHTTTDSTLGILRELRGEYPWVGAVLQAYLRRTEQDCRELSGPGSRVRLCKGAYAEPESVAFAEKSEVDKSYVRCLRVLMAGQGYPMVASHDPRMIEIAAALAEENGRKDDDHEFQMLYGIRPEEQARIAAAGSRMRVYVPYGDEWYGYFMRRLAERPANLGFFLRGLATRS